MADYSQRKSGVTSISEQIDREFLSYKSVGELNEAWTEKLAHAMMEQKRALKDPGDRGAFSVVKSPAAQEKYSKLCKTISDAYGKAWNAARIAEEWALVQEEAIARYRALLMRASAPPLPDQTLPFTPAEEELIEITEGISIVEDAPVAETLPASLQLEQWADWRTKPLNNETVGSLNFSFANALAEKLATLSDRQLKDVKEVYMTIVKGMYGAAYPGSPPENIGSAIESYWVMVLSATRLILPAVKSPKESVS